MKKNLFQAAGLLLIINVCVKLLGFGRELVIADAFGASYASDAYLVAYTIPYFLQSILGFAFVSAVLPTLSGVWNESGDNMPAFRLGSTLMNVVALATLALSAIGVLAAPVLVEITAPSLADSTAKLAVSLTRIIFPSVMFMSVGMVISGVLNSRYRFAAAAVAPGLASTGLILAVTLFPGSGIYGAATGTLVGYFFFFLVPALDLPKSGFRYLPGVCDLKNPLVRRALVGVIPIVLGLSVNQIYTVVNRIFASGLPEGSISALNYASKLMNLPLGVFASAVITALFPTFAELAAKKDHTALGRSATQGVFAVLLMVVPAVAGLILLDHPIVRLLFESGSFDETATAVTAQALVAMAPGMIFLGITMLLVRVFFALDDLHTPLLAGAASILVNVVISLALADSLGHVGLAWANTVAAMVNALWLFMVLRRRIPLGLPDSGRELVLIFLATMIMSITVIVIWQVLPLAASRSQLALEVLLTIGAGMGVYGGMLIATRSSACTMLLHAVAKKRTKK